MPPSRPWWSCWEVLWKLREGKLDWRKKVSVCVLEGVMLRRGSALVGQVNWSWYVDRWTIGTNIYAHMGTLTEGQSLTLHFIFSLLVALPSLFFLWSVLFPSCFPSLSFLMFFCLHLFFYPFFFSNFSYSFYTSSYKDFYARLSHYHKLHIFQTKLKSLQKKMALGSCYIFSLEAQSSATFSFVIIFPTKHLHPKAKVLL